MATVTPRIRFRTALVAVLVFAVALLGGCGGRNPLQVPDEPKGPLLAYRSSTELGLVDGTTVIATAPGDFPASNDPITTEDGRFLFARGSDGKLVTLNVTTRKAATLPVAPDSRVGTAGGSTVVWWEQPDRLMQLDLADPETGPSLRQRVQLPPIYGPQSGDPTLLTARAGTAILARVETTPSADGGPDTLYAVRGPGGPSELGQTDANTPVAAARLSADGSTLAYAMYRRSSNTCGTAAVAVVAADGSQQTYDVAAEQATTGSQVVDMWWPTSGPLMLSLDTWRCEPPGPVIPRIWQVDGGRLAQLSPPTSALRSAEIVPGQRALIVPEDTTSPQQSGTLVIEDSGRRFTVRPDVDALAVVRP